MAKGTTVRAGEFRASLWGAAASALVVFGGVGFLKLTKVFRTDPGASVLDVARCVAPDAFFAAVVGLALVLLRWPAARSRRGSIALVAAEALFVSTTLGFAMLEHQSWERSGTLLDWKLFSYTLKHLDELSALIGAETNWRSWAELAGFVALGLVPLAVELFHHRWPVWAARRRRFFYVIGPSLAASGAMMLGAPASPRVHPFARSAPVRFVADAVSSSVEAAAEEPAAPPVETSILVKEKLAKHPPKRTPTETTPENLLVIVLESTRWDATTVYRPELPTTPALAKLAEHALVPETVYVDMPHTSKALVSILCGYPPRWVQAIEEAEPGGLNRPCAAHILGSLGYGTAYFQSATGKFENRKRLVENFGYKFFRAKEHYDATGFEQTNYLGLEDKVMTKPILAWVDEQHAAKKPFFATVLTTISHHDYGIPSHMKYEEIVGGVSSQRYNRYLNTVKYADSFIGDVVKGLEARGLLDSTLIVVVGDHGQAFFEHGRKGHNDVVWEEGVRVPLLFSNPKAFPARTPVAGLRRQTDILPTALGVMGIETEPSWVEGRDLRTAPAYDSVVTSCWYDDKCMVEHRESLALISHFDERPMEVYDLAADPKQQDDLLDQEDGPRFAEVKRLAAEAQTRMSARRAAVNRSFEDAVTETPWLLKKEPSPEHIVYARYGDYVEVLGWDGPATVDPGTFWDFTIYFRCLEPSPPAHKWFGHLETLDGRRVKLDHHGAKGRVQLMSCPAGTIVRDELSAYIPPTFPEGELTLWYGVFHGSERVPAERTSLEEKDDRVALIRPRVTGNHEPELRAVLDAAVTRTPPPSLGAPAGVEFGDALELVEVKVEPREVRRRAEFEVLATWRVKEPLRGRWRVFVHADPVRGKRVRNDMAPVGGLLPVAMWKAGTYIQDRYPLYVSHKWGWPIGEPVQLYFGIYRDDERLSVTNPGRAKVSEDRIDLGTVRIVE